MPRPRPRRRRRVEQETRDHIALATWLRSAGVFFWHTPNEGKRSATAGRKLKKMGMLPGVADIIILDRPPAHPDVPFVALELKTETGRATLLQQQFLAKVTERGGLARVCHGFADAVSWLQSLGWGVAR